MHRLSGGEGAQSIVVSTEGGVEKTKADRRVCRSDADSGENRPFLVVAMADPDLQQNAARQLLTAAKIVLSWWWRWLTRTFSKTPPDNLLFGRKTCHQR
jgi:hypothetical protein